MNTLMKQLKIAILLAIIPFFSFAENFTIKGVDESCSQEFSRVTQRCGDGTSTAIKACWQQRLSPDCFKKVKAGTGTSDSSCKQELKHAAIPCTEASQTFGARCMKENLSQRCIAQLTKAEQVFGKSKQVCQEAMQRRLQICKADGQKETDCLQRHQSEVNSACQ